MKRCDEVKTKTKKIDKKKEVKTKTKPTKIYKKKPCMSPVSLVFHTIVMGD